ncbi:hypothetical protein BDF14DRAFT_1848507 [Spinellus fusiger]|nr:hypothetical protein BDF14DRAFT_1848507 [Spinellus fusiger]
MDISELLHGMQPKTLSYMGTGYAILDIDPQQGQDISPLTHLIPWMNTSDGFHAMWNDMPTWCRYCYEHEHGRNECPQRPSRQLRC